MKTKYIIISLLLSIYSLTMQAQTTITSSDVISVTTAYVNDVSMTWNVNGTVTNKPLLVNYNIGTEYLFDFVKIYSIGSDGTETLLVSLSGIQSGSISSVVPTGKVKITFTSDGSVCYQNNPALFSGIQITFSSDNSYPSSTFANSYISGNSIVNGNVGIGVLNPSYKLEVNGTAKFLENVQCSSSISFRDNARFSVTPSTIPDLRTSSFSMPQYGIGSPITGGSADLWLSGNNSIRMFTAGNVNPVVNILPNGNVGIGTTTPSDKLSVAGGISKLTLSGIDGVYDNVLKFGYKGDLESGTININRWHGIDATITAGAAAENKMKFRLYGGGTSSAAPIDVMTLQGDGNVGIGTTTPQYKLDVTGGIRATNELIVSGSGADIGGAISIINMSKTVVGQASTWRIFNMSGYYGNSLQFWAYDNTNCGGGLCNNRLTLMDNGNVGIGLTNPDELLTVNGTIHAKEVKVALTGPLADYVFNSTYKLMPLHEVEQFVNVNSHLPEMPSAAEVSKNGLNMGEMQNKLLQKVEELTLYMIEQQKTINQQSAKIEELEKKLK